MKRAAHRLWCLALLCCASLSIASEIPQSEPVTSLATLSKDALFFKNNLIPQLEKLGESIAQSAVCLVAQKNDATTQTFVSYLMGIEHLASIEPQNVDNKFLSMALQIIHGVTQDLLIGLKNGFVQFPPFDSKRYLSNEIQLTPEQQTVIAQQVTAVIDALVKDVNEKVQDVLAEPVVTIRNQITTLDFTLQKIAGVINGSNHKNKTQLRDILMELRSVLQLIQQQILTAPASVRLLEASQKITHAIINQLNACTKNKFQALELLDLEKLLTRKPGEGISSIEELRAQMALTSKDLAKLQATAEKADLSYINRLARTFDDYVVVPAQKYKLPTRIGTGLALGGLATFLWYYFDQHAYADSIPGFRKFFGWRSTLQTIKVEKTTDERGNQIELTTKIQHPDRPITWLGRLDQYIADVYTGSTPIGKFLTATVAAAAYKEWSANINPWMRKKVSVLFNRLKGGSYRKIADGIEEIRPEVTFDNIIGLEYAKSMVRPHLKYIKDPERWDASEIAPPTGILLTGPTRTGKTFLARAIQGEINKENPEKGVRFFALDANMLQSESLELWLHMAKLYAPCVIFIDEIDLLGLQRSSNAKRLSEFLQAMSGVLDKDPKKQVIIIATTNRPENLDTALLQNGRFGLEIRFQMPTCAERKEYIERELNKHAIDPESFGIDIDYLTYQTEDCSYEDIKSMIDDAFISGSIRGEILNQALFERSLDKKIRKIVDFDSKNITAKEKQFMAAHQAGRTLVHLLLELDSKISKVTIKPIVVKVKEEGVIDQYYKPTGSKQTGTELGAVFTYHEHDTNDLITNEEREKIAKSYLAGRIAEKVLLGTCSNFKTGYKQWVFKQIKTTLSGGIDLKEMSKKDQERINATALAQIAQYESEIEQLLITHKDKLSALSDALFKYETLSIDEITKIISEQKA